MDTSQIQEQVLQDFRNLATFDPGRISVSVEEGTVVLKGHVDTWADYEEAELVALGVPGVRRVRNLLGISP